MDKAYEPYWSDYLKQFDIDNKYFNITTKTNKFCVLVEQKSMWIT